MGVRRTYGEGCAAAHALDLVGERWALLVVRELLLGPKRFTDLREGIPHASPNVLSQRLRELEDSGVVRRGTLPPPAASRIYELTEWGRGLEPVILALGEWGVRSPHRPRGDMSVDCYALALKTAFDPDAAEGLEATFQLRLDGQRFRARVAEGRFEVARGTVEDPDATIVTDTGTFKSLLWDGRKLADARHAGDVQITGDEKALARFLRLFPEPDPVALAASA
jgi:DNA-binding HxlR family transcriptional regulator/putative sterol carrier protein